MSPPVKPEQDPGYVPTGAEWAAAQYGPHRFGQDPNAQLPMGRVPTGAEWDQMRRSSNPSKLTFPALPTPKFVADQTKRLNPNAGKPDQSILESLQAPVFSSEGIKKVAAGFDAASAALGPMAGAGSVVGPVLRQAVAPIVEHPIGTAAGIAAATASPLVVGGLFAADQLANIAKYGYQTAHEQMMTPEQRAVAQQDPNRISGEAALVQLAFLGLGAFGMKHGLDTELGWTKGLSDEYRPVVLSVPGATQLGSTAAEKGLPATASPYPPESPLSAAWKAGHDLAPKTEPTAPSVASPPEYPRAGATVDGRIVGDQVHNLPSIESTLTDYTEVPGIREVPMEHLSTRGALDYTSADDRARVAKLVDEIKKSGRIDPLIVAVDEKGPYIIEGGHRLAALKELGAKSFPAKIVEEPGARYIPTTGSPGEAAAPTVAEPTVPPAAPTEPVGATSGLTPIEGTGETRTRGLATSTVSRVAEDIKSLWSDLPEYQRISISEQAHRAQDLITQDPVRAKSIAMGDEPAPIGLHAEAVFVALRNKARAEGDVGLIHDLATGGLTEQATTMGQKLRLLAENDPEDPVAKIRRISDKRSEGRGAAKAIKSETDVIAKHTELNLKSLMDFFESQKC